MRGTYLPSRGSGHRALRNPAADLPLFLRSGRRELPPAAMSFLCSAVREAMGNEHIDLSLLNRSKGYFLSEHLGSACQGQIVELPE
jgi:hypothetical protein